MQPIEIRPVVNGELKSVVMPPVARRGDSGCADSGTGPRCHRRSDLPEMAQYGTTLEIILSGWGWEPLLVITATSHSHWFALPQYRPSGYPAKSLSNERWRDQQRPLRTNRPILAETCVHGVGKQCLRLWLQHQRLHYRHQSMPGMLRSLRLQFKCEPNRHRLTRVGESIYRRLPIDGKQSHRPQSHWHIAPGHGGKRAI